MPPAPRAAPCCASPGSRSAPGAAGGGGERPRASPAPQPRVVGGTTRPAAGQQHLVDVVNRVEERHAADVDEEGGLRCERCPGAGEGDAAAEPVEVAQQPQALGGREELLDVLVG